MHRHFAAEFNSIKSYIKNVTTENIRSPMLVASQFSMCIITSCQAYFSNGCNQESVSQCTDNNSGVVYSSGSMFKELIICHQIKELQITVHEFLM